MQTATTASKKGMLSQLIVLDAVKVLGECTFPGLTTFLCMDIVCCTLRARRAADPQDLTKTKQKINNNTETEVIYL